MAEKAFEKDRMPILVKQKLSASFSFSNIQQSKLRRTAKQQKSLVKNLKYPQTRQIFLLQDKVSHDNLRRTSQLSPSEVTQSLQKYL